MLPFIKGIKYLCLAFMQVGCGVGNTIFPLLEINTQSHVYACDFSKRAVQLVQEHPQYSTGRVTAFVADITSTLLVDHVPANSINYCTMVFVLSAVAPENMGKVRKHRPLQALGLLYNHLS